MNAEKLKRALLQSSFLAASLLICFAASYFLRDGLMIGSLAASCFIAFGFPKAHSSEPKFLIGGYLCGAACGAAAALISIWFGLEHIVGIHIIMAVLAAFGTSLLMLLLELQHPPAAALAVAISLEAQPIYAAIVAMMSILLICAIKLSAEKILYARDSGIS